MVGQVHSSFLIYYTIKLTHTHTASLAAQHVQADVVQPLSTHTLVSLALRHVQAEVLLAVGKHILHLYYIIVIIVAMAFIITTTLRLIRTSLSVNR